MSGRKQIFSLLPIRLHLCVSNIWSILASNVGQFLPKCHRKCCQVTFEYVKTNSSGYFSTVKLCCLVEKHLYIQVEYLYTLQALYKPLLVLLLYENFLFCVIYLFYYFLCAVFIYNIHCYSNWSFFMLNLLVKFIIFYIFLSSLSSVISC